jgi:hypothetical protein
MITARKACERADKAFNNFFLSDRKSQTNNGRENR